LKTPKERIVIYHSLFDRPLTLGLDCSSAVVGWGILDAKMKLVAHGHFKPLDSKFSLIERLNSVFEGVNDICIKFCPDRVSVEDITLHMKGKSNAKTVTLLAAVNRVASLSAWRISKSLYYYGVTKIRSVIRKEYGLDKIDKQGIPDIIRQHLDDRFSNILKRNGKIADTTMDEADGIAAAWASCILDSGEGNEQKSV
jgi:Holliday junction resolvasome RuvABC endonuclease subunit